MRNGEGGDVSLRDGPPTPGNSSGVSSAVYVDSPVTPPSTLIEFPQFSVDDPARAVLPRLHQSMLSPRATMRNEDEVDPRLCSAIRLFGDKKATPHRPYRSKTSIPRFSVKSG